MSSKEAGKWIDVFKKFGVWYRASPHVVSVVYMLACSLVVYLLMKGQIGKADAGKAAAEARADRCEERMERRIDQLVNRQDNIETKQGALDEKSDTLLQRSAANKELFNEAKNILK